MTWSFASSNFSQLAQRYSGYHAFDSYITDAYRATVEKAAAAWAAVANINLVEVVDSAAVNIRIGNAYIDGPATPGQSSIIGQTQTWQISGSLAAAEIYFDSDAYQNSNFYEVVVHEMGHALGLDHSSVASAVMYYQVNSQNRSGLLTADDIAGIQHIYGPLAASLPAITSIETLQGAFRNILRIDPGSLFALTPAIGGVANPAYTQAAGLAALAAQVDSGAKTLADAIGALGRYADATTSVATLSYQFFTGRAPTAAGLDYLVHSDANATDLNDAYYARFNLENRYINFAVNLGKLGEGKDAFAARYGSLSLSDAVKTAYTAIFGTAPTTAKVSAILDASVTLGGQTMTRAAYLASYGLDGQNGIGTKAAAVGYLLVEALKADVGPLVQANDHFLSDLADGAAKYNVDLTAAYSARNAVDSLYGAPDAAIGVVGASQPIADLHLS